jgi:hypothetical protein
VYVRYRIVAPLITNLNEREREREYITASSQPKIDNIKVPPHYNSLSFPFIRPLRAAALITKREREREALLRWKKRIFLSTLTRLTRSARPFSGERRQTHKTNKKKIAKEKHYDVCA